MFSLLIKVLKRLYEAAITHAASDEGASSLVEILNELEADGVDVPFYQPSETVSDAGAQVAQASNKASAYTPPVGKRTVPQNQQVGES